MMMQMNNNMVIGGERMNVWATACETWRAMKTTTEEIKFGVGEKLAAFYSREVGEEISPKQAYRITNAIAAFASLAVLSASPITCIPAAVWFAVAMKGCRK